MEKKRVVPVWVSVILLVLCAAVTVQSIIGLFTNELGGIFIVYYAMDIITVVLAAFYCLSGYQKPSAKYFKAVSISFLIVSAIALGLAFKNSQLFDFIFMMIIFGCLSVFSVAKDLGKRRSLFMAGLMILCFLISSVIFAVTWSSVLSPISTNLLLSVIFFIMVIAKYKDKEARGTK